jgi:serine/threonine-protein kinase RsbT
VEVPVIEPLPHNNMLIYGGRGTVQIQLISHNSRQGVNVIFVDSGRGIPDVELAMEQGYSTGKTLCIGFPGAKRFSDRSEINSELGKGTTVKITKWR